MVIMTNVPLAFCISDARYEMNFRRTDFFVWQYWSNKYNYCLFCLRMHNVYRKEKRAITQQSLKFRIWVRWINIFISIWRCVYLRSSCVTQTKLLIFISYILVTNVPQFKNIPVNISFFYAGIYVCQSNKLYKI